MDSLHPFVVRYKIHSNKEKWLCCDICVIILCFIYVRNAAAISDAHYSSSYNLQLHHIINEYMDLILEFSYWKKDTTGSRASIQVN